MWGEEERQEEVKANANWEWCELLKPEIYKFMVPLTFEHILGRSGRNWWARLGGEYNQTTLYTIKI